ncbi:MAG: hypothetical protein AAB884_01510 [Patescibacteria group bacterium]
MRENPPSNESNKWFTKEEIEKLKKELGVKEDDNSLYLEGKDGRRHYFMKWRLLEKDIREKKKELGL